MRVTLNVQGTLFVTTTQTLTDLAPDGMLAMLLRHHTEGEIFINRDAGMFRWILLALNTGQLVDHTTVGVPKDVWDTEVDYYGLFDTPIVPESKKRERVSTELAEKAKKYCEGLEIRKQDAIRAREKEYGVLMEYIMSTINPEGKTGYMFVTPTKDAYPYNYKAELRFMNLKQLDEKKDELRTFAEALGFIISVGDYRTGSMVRKYDRYPAMHTNFTYAHEELKIVAWRKE